MLKNFFVLMSIIFLLSGCVNIQPKSAMILSVQASHMGMDSMYNLLHKGDLEVGDIQNFKSNEDGKSLSFTIKNKISYQKEIDETNEIRTEIVSTLPIEKNMLSNLLDLDFTPEQKLAIETKINKAIETNTNQKIELDLGALENEFIDVIFNGSININNEQLIIDYEYEFK